MLQKYLNKPIKDCSNEEIYVALLNLTKDTTKVKGTNKGDRKLYYISAEFLIGKLLSNNLINLGLYDDVKKLLSENGKSLSEIEEVELEPSLGNGGLGRLAACFLDSIATLGLNGDGVGLNYHCGLFKQLFENYKQKEVKNPWITDNSWLNKSDISFEVPFKDFTLKSTLYDIDVTGYDNHSNKLRLFDIDTVDESIVDPNGIGFNKEDIEHNLTLFLYPDDSDEAGRRLRIYQQYFMVSNAAQLILKELKDNGYELKDLAKHIVVQINDTHPTMVIPELIRLLTAEGISMDEAIEIVTKTCAYTNHTILAEALEKWPIHYLENIVPQLIPIIKELDARVRAKYNDQRLYIIDDNNLVHMARIDIHYGFSVNGVASLHTDILKNSELKVFYDIYPEKFNNKTNGITFRRWLMHCNPELNAYIEQLIGDGYKKNAYELEKLLQFKDNGEVLQRMSDIKRNNKIALKNYIRETQGIEIDENSIYDIQVKRLHEYKRQQMNALYLIYKYNEIRNGHLPQRPITMIFGAKAAPAYTIAKDIIHLILCMQQLINSDSYISKYLKVVMIENYNVTKAEKLIPACDVSEQISLASKEASGTGNMKFMLNGAVTLGTMDGANVEISNLVGRENIYIFGKSSQEVINLYAQGTYHPWDIYNNDELVRRTMDYIIDRTLLLMGEPNSLVRLYKEILSKDWFMALPDTRNYIETKERLFRDYENRYEWNKKMLVNTAKAGYFSSDRTIEEYNRDIWKLK